MQEQKLITAEHGSALTNSHEKIRSPSRLLLTNRLTSVPKNDDRIHKVIPQVKYKFNYLL